ncbi:MAG: DUF1289 domain-containing protein [Porticoccaceae bacterium]|nr:DUF1289 domain-containing protein [Porticoccaceae bacterium]
MEQREFFAIPNPCQGVCKSGPRGFCHGCFRSRDERQHWNRLDDPTKRKIVHACALRKRRYELGQSIVDEQDEPILQQSLFD